MPAYDTYANALLSEGHGFPLWEPDPGEYASVMIADVGYISEGGFLKLFNASTEADAKSNMFGLPSGHTPLPVGAIRRRTPLSKQPEYIATKGVSKSGVNIGGSAGAAVTAGGGINFACENDHGAILVLGDIAHRQDAMELGRFAKYITKHHEAWLEFANGDSLDRGITLGDLILVTGCDMTSQWACATWSQSSKSGALRFIAEGPGVASGQVNIWGSWESASSVSRNAGPQLRATHPTEAEVITPVGFMQDESMQAALSPTRSIAPSLIATQSDQCVFVRGFRIGARRAWFRRKTIIDLGDGFKTVKKPIISQRRSMSDNNSRGHNRSKPLGLGQSSGAEDGAPVDPVDSRDDEGHSSSSDEGYEPDTDIDTTPEAAVITYIFSKQAAIELALVHTDDMIDLFQVSGNPCFDTTHCPSRGEYAIPDYGHWIRQISPVVYTQGSVGMLRGTCMASLQLDNRDSLGPTASALLPLEEKYPNDRSVSTAAIPTRKVQHTFDDTRSESSLGVAERLIKRVQSWRTKARVSTSSKPMSEMVIEDSDSRLSAEGEEKAVNAPGTRPMSRISRAISNRARYIIKYRGRRWRMSSESSLDIDKIQAPNMSTPSFERKRQYDG